MHRDKGLVWYFLINIFNLYFILLCFLQIFNLKTEICTGMQNFPGRRPENETSVVIHEKLWKITPIKKREEERHLGKVQHDV